MHQAVSELGAPFAKTVIQAHALTGYDCMSKMGAKHAATTCNPVQYLTNVGETDTLSEQDVVLAENVRCTCLGMGQVNHNWSYIQSVEGRTFYHAAPELELMLFLLQAVEAEDTSTEEPFLSESMLIAWHRQ